MDVSGDFLLVSSLLSSDTSSLSEGADLDIDGRLMKGSRGRSKVTLPFVSFAFSLTVSVHSNSISTAVSVVSV